ncbi:MAG: Antitoxin, partial [Acidobacteria bacterium]|nr:Antitoxin [Acidobacteriota bacterium]
MTRVATSKLSEQLPEMLDRVAKRGERIVLRRKGKDVGAIVSVRDLRLLRKIEDHLDNQA